MDYLIDNRLRENDALKQLREETAQFKMAIVQLSPDLSSESSINFPQ